MLKTVLKYMEVKATMTDVDIPGLSPGDITFLGVVSSQQYQSIIVNAKVCIVAAAAVLSRFSNNTCKEQTV